ncbi:TorD/DmsD family molecular chaperone [Gordonibacter sp.]|uniref:TorD/DmsD family molecular chaperone n=1 Tax=Gordonibacter sp. TaxID=1968902 RepID=UPI002FCBF942
MSNNERESALAMDLARRVYLYRLWQVVFGGPLTDDGVSKVFCSEALALFDHVREALSQSDFEEIAACPVGLSGLSLGTCAEGVFACIEKVGCEVDGPSQEAAFARVLRDDYSKLFQVPGDRYVHLWESPYTGKESMVFQESTLDVRSFYHDAGFKLQAEGHFPDDHIAAMMDYMAHLGQRAYEAYADGRDDEVLLVLATQRQFADRHILTWVNLFADRVIKNDAHAYYGALAGGMAAFVRVDRAMIEQLEKNLTEQ